MMDKSELEKTIEYAIGGIPQIKPDEKRKWLGEFRERVILGLTMEQSFMIEAQDYVEDALKDNMAEIIIVNQKIPMEVMSKYMKLAKDTSKEFKTISTNSEEAMGIVVVSRQAVERGNVEVEIKEVPARFKETNNKEICGDCYKEVTVKWPKFSKRFKKFGFLDRIMGTKCPICKK